MEWKKRSVSYFLLIMLFIFSYYSWLIAWRGAPEVLVWGGGFFSVLGSLAAAVWLTAAYKRSGHADKRFWLLLALGCYSYMVAELCWMYYENVAGIKLPFPGLPDVFYILHALFFLAALISTVMQVKKQHQWTRLLFDTAIVMTVAFTFSWHFILCPIVTNNGADALSLIVSLVYPVSDLALFLCLTSLYFSRQKTLSGRGFSFILAGLLAQLTADTAFLYLVSINEYHTGSLINPIFILSLLLLGFAGVLQQQETEAAEEKREEQEKELDWLRLSLPYANVLLLFSFMMVHAKNSDAVTIGSSVAILLVMVRQVFTIVENQRLLEDISKKAEELEISKEKYKSLFEYHPDAVYSVNTEGTFESVNAAGAKLLGFDKQEMIGRPVFSLSKHTTKSHQRKVKQALEEALEGEPQSYEISLQSKSGTQHVLSVTNIPIIVKKKTIGIFGVGKDITESKKNEQQINYLAYHDSLTGLWNRAYFDEALKKSAAASKKTSEMFAVIFIDLDQFKRVNDTLGHDAGDELLVLTAARLQDCVKKEDTVARRGGDEFTLLIRRLTGFEEAEKTAQTILAALHKPYLLKSGLELISLPSIGISICPLNGTEPSDLVKQADRAMYEVKENGKGAYKLYQTQPS